MPDDRSMLAQYRLTRAKECLSDAQDDLIEGRLTSALNRSYYAMFHATRALLALDNFDSKRHSTIIGYFHQHYIAPARIDRKYHQMLSRAFRTRNESDYDDFYEVNQEDVEEQVRNAVIFVAFMVEHIAGALSVSSAPCDFADRIDTP